MPAKLSETMEACLATAEVYGSLVRYDGGFWARPDDFVVADTMQEFFRLGDATKHLRKIGVF